MKLLKLPMMKRHFGFFETEECKVMKTPLHDKLDFKCGRNEIFAQSSPYRQLIGSHLPLVSTVQLEIAYAFGYHLHIRQNLIDQLWRSATYVLRYLKGTGNLEVTFHSRGECSIWGFLNADWGQERPKLESVSRNVLMGAGSMGN